MLTYRPIEIGRLIQKVARERGEAKGRTSANIDFQLCHS